MSDMSTLKLGFQFGPYITPVISRGVRVMCEVRGLVKITGLSAGPIPWPIGERAGQRALIVYKGLARAVRLELPETVAAAWNVGFETVESWRKSIPTRATTRHRSGLSRQRTPRANKPVPRANKPDDQPWTSHEDDVLRTISPDLAIEKLQRSRKAVDARREQLGLPPLLPEPDLCCLYSQRRSKGPFKRWEAWEDDLLAKLSLAEAAERLGRTWLAVAQRRHRLGLTSPPAVAVEKAREAKRAKRAVVIEASLMTRRSRNRKGS
jgi:hypothetical protein